MLSAINLFAITNEKEQVMKTKLTSFALGLLSGTMLRTLPRKTALACPLALQATLPAPALAAPTPDELRTLARDVYYFAYSTVLMDVTMRQETAVPNATAVTGRAPINQFAYFRSYPKADAKDVVRFNFDMLYSTKASRCRIRSTASPSATATS